VVIRDIAGSTGDRIDRNYNVVYEYLQQQAVVRSPSELIRKFQNLLQNGRNEEAAVSQAFEKIIFSQESQFDLFLSQCFYHIISVWLDSPESLTHIAQLLDIPNLVAQSRSYDRRRKQLIQSIKNYQVSASYQQLEFVVNIIGSSEAIVEDLHSSLTTNKSLDSKAGKTPLVANYLIRYPYLYQQLLPEEAAIPRLLEQVRELQNQRQTDFEIKLSKHIIYRFRLKQLAKMRMMTRSAGKMIVKADNPSLLSEKAFRIALQQYVGKLDRGYTLQERAQLFIAENKHRSTYNTFKQDLYRFIVKDIKPRNKTYQFESRLKQKLDSIFPQANEKSLNSTQVLQTSRQLFSFLIVDPNDSKNSAQFEELVANLGTAQAVNILVKVVLICPESKTDLERKIWAISNRYRSETVQSHPWLLKALEHLLIAFSIYFGSVDVSIAKSVVSKS